MKKVLEYIGKLSKKNTVVLLVVVNALAVSVIVMLSVFFKIKIDKINFEERRSNLSNVTELSSSLISSEIESGWNFVYTVVDLVDCKDNDFVSFDEFYSSVERYISNSGYSLSIYDSDAHFYNSNGTSGRLSDVKRFKPNTPDYLIFLSQATDGTTQIIYRIRLKNSLSIRTDSGFIEVNYCSLSIPAEQLLDEVHTNFDFGKSCFFFDMSTGKVINENLDSINKNTNIYDFFTKINANKITEAENVIDSIKNGNSASNQVHINGKNYFYSVTPLVGTDSVLGVIVSSEELATSSSSFTGIMFIYVACILFMIGIVIFTLYATYLTSMNNQVLLEKEIEANKYLSRAEEEAKKASDSKSTFLFNMSHDIRTPLNAIKGFTEMAVKNIGDSEKVSDCLSKIQKSENQLLSLVNDVLDLSRIESGKAVINPEDTNLIHLCENCSEIIEGQLIERQIEYTHNFNNISHSRVFADELHFRRIMVNLIGNSIKFTPDGGKITFSCSETDFNDDTATFEFKISDTGIGMTPEFLTKIWMPFEQAENSGRTKYKGTGLGTTITKQLVELMGGSISVESEVNIGTTFTVIIPFKTAGESNEIQENIDETDISLDNLKVLLVEDNELNAEIAQEILSDENMLVTWVENGRVACEKFAESADGEYQVILMDIQMPEMNGYEATQVIRNMIRNDAKTIPIIALSANAFSEDIKKSIDSGMNGHVSKPIDIESLKTSIRKVL